MNQKSHNLTRRTGQQMDQVHKDYFKHNKNIFLLWWIVIVSG